MRGKDCPSLLGGTQLARRWDPVHCDVPVLRAGEGVGRWQRGGEGRGRRESREGCEGGRDSESRGERNKYPASHSSSAHSHASCPPGARAYPHPLHPSGSPDNISACRASQAFHVDSQPAPYALSPAAGSSQPVSRRSSRSTQPCWPSETVVAKHDLLQPHCSANNDKTGLLSLSLASCNSVATCGLLSYSPS